jgi:hypothetical protein
MASKKIYAFIFSLILLGNWAVAQTNVPTTEKPTVEIPAPEKQISKALEAEAAKMNAPKPEIRSINLGTDLTRFALPILDSTRIGWEVSGDFELLKDMFVGAEVGFQTTKVEKTNYTYSGNGYYTRIGVDYNFMKHVDEKSLDKMLIGLHYGFTTFNHQAEKVRVPSTYFGDFTGGAIEKNWLSANWLEVALGMRTELLANFYLGWSLRIRMKVWAENDPNMQPYYIPGYGRAYGNNAFGFNYSLFYQIPIKKKQKP